MANGIDRLERLFSKKKHAATREPSAAGRPSSLAYTPSRFTLRKGPASPSSPTRPSPLQDLHFPQPSFIRPTAARMVPRDDSAPPPRPATAGRSQSVPEPPAVPTGGATSLRGVAPARGGATRGPLGPPVAASQARSMSVATSRGGYDSKRSSAITYGTTNTSSSGGSTTTSSGNRRSFIETPCELSEVAARAVPEGQVLASIDVQRLPKRSSSLLQRRDVFVAPLSSLDTYQLQKTQRDSVAITVSSGEISPATIQQTTPVLSSSPKVPQPELKIQGDELQDLQDLQDLQGLPDLQTLKDLQQPLFFPQQQTPSPSDKDEQKRQSQATLVLEPASSSSSSETPSAGTAQTTPESSPKVGTAGDSKLTGVTESKSNEIAFTETPLLCRDSVFASIVLPQNRPTSPAVSARRRSRITRRPMSLRYQRHLPAEPAPSSPSSVLIEPNLGDFLSLSDDDIAEAVPAGAAAAAAAAAAEKDEKVASSAPPATVADTKTSPQSKSLLALQKPLPPAPSEVSMSPPVSPTSITRRRALAAAAPSHPPSFQAPPPAFLSLLPGMPLLPSPMSSSTGRPRTPAGEARMAAAFEIARIASQYKFDLAYIATIWPKNMAFLQSSGASSIGWPSSPSSPASTKLVSRTNSQASRVSSPTSQANRASHMGHTSQSSQASCVSNHSMCSSIHTISSTGTSRTTATTGTASLSNHGSFAPVSRHQPKLEAQFLAAYGLATVRAPYSLSAPTHAKILNAERWLEFNEPDAKPDEFARGYGCAFYRGHAPVAVTPLSQQRYQRRPSTDDCDADTEQDYSPSGRTTPRPARRTHRKAAVSQASTATSNSSSSSSSSGSATLNNRGIVFVAYRRKEVDDVCASRQEKDDLVALYRDVEALVDKILDVHMQQQRQAQLETQRATPDVEHALAAGFNGAGASCTLRQSRFLGVKAAA